MAPIYLDHHATTPCVDEVVAAMLPWFGVHFGNAGSSAHGWGVTASAGVDRARAAVARLLGAPPEEIVFTSGATEADNLAVLGLCRAAPADRRHLVVGATEHRAVLAPAEHLAQRGWDLTVVAPDAEGRIHPDAVAAAIRPDTALVSVMLAQNEIGTINPVREIAEVCRAAGVPMHTDAAQAVGHVPVDVRALGVDLLSLTAHKFYGPKGVGALWIRRGRPALALEPLQHGGGQERGLRSGTLPVPLLVGLGAAADLAARHLADGEPARVAALRDRLWDGLRDLPGVHRFGPDGADRLPHNLLVCVEGRRSADLLRALRPTVGLSAGSACATGRAEPSHVLTAIGVPPALAQGSLRFGLGRSTSADDVDAVIRAVRDALHPTRGSNDADRV
jgi:cysteine desulfurase